MLSEQTMGEGVVNPGLQGLSVLQRLLGLNRLALPPTRLGKGYAQLGALRHPEGIAAECRGHAAPFEHARPQQAAVTVDLLAQRFGPLLASLSGSRGKEVMFV